MGDCGVAYSSQPGERFCRDQATMRYAVTNSTPHICDLDKFEIKSVSLSNYEASLRARVGE